MIETVYKKPSMIVKSRSAGFVFLFIILSICNSFTGFSQTVVWSEDFEEAGAGDSYTTNQASIPNLTNNWEYQKTNEGRLRMAAGAGYYKSGSRSATFDTDPTGNQSENYIIAIIDISAYSSYSNFGLSFSFMDHGDENHNTDRVWARTGNDDSQPWVQVYDIVPQSRTNGTWIDVTGIDITSALAAQPSSSYIQLRFGQQDNWNTNAVGSNDGITYDDIKLVGLPSDFGNSPGLVFWLRGDAGVSGTNPITAWADQSGNGNDASPDPTGPVLVTSGTLNSQPALSFDGTRELNIPDDARINTGGGYNGDERSMFFAFSTGADVSSSTPQYLYEQGGGTNGLGIYIKNGNIYVNIYNGGGTERITSYNSISANTGYIVSFVWNNGSLTAKINNVAFSGQTTNGTITTLNADGGNISIGFTNGNTINETGGTHSSPGSFTGEIAEILYYDLALNSADEITLNDNLATKYNISQTLDADYYFSYQSGNWEDASTWTHDPGGTTQTATDVPNSADNVIILSGRTVSLSADVDTTNLDITIRDGGILDQASFQFTAGLSALRGSGTFKLASVNFPSVATNDFVTTDAGTTEYNNAGNFTFPSSQSTYYHLRLNAPGVTAMQLSNITLNGDLHIKQGTYQVNDNTANRRQLIINGDVTVDNGASFTVGTGVTNTTTDPTAVAEGGTAPFINYYDTQSHRIVVYGDFTNNGTVQLTNLTYPVYDQLPPTTLGATSGYATLYFMGATDNTLTCSGTTDVYNLVLDKGIDQSYSLTIYSSAYSNFRLFGANTAGGYGGGANPDLNKALWIRTGSLVLKGLTIIPSLSEGTCDSGTGGPSSDFFIPANGALILDGSEVVVLSTADDYREVNIAYGVSGGSGLVNGVGQGGCSSFSILGKLEINNGYFSTRESSGFITWSDASGQLEINGGIVDAKQFRSSGGVGGLASFTQTGGTFLLRGRFQRVPAAYSSVTDLKDFSTATLNTTRTGNGIDGAYGTFNLNEVDNVYNMSGGTIRVYDACDGGGLVFDVFSSDGNINVSGGTVEFIPTTGTGGDAAIHYVQSNAPFYNMTINRASSTSTVELNTYQLIVQNDLNLTSGVLTSADFDVTVGGDFYIQNGTTYTPGNNSTIFDGAGDQTLTLNNAGTTAFKKLKVDKPAGTSITLAGAGSVLSVQDSLVIYDAELADGGKTIQLTTSGTSNPSVIYNSGSHTGTGTIEIADNDPTIITGDGSGIFENIDLNNSDASTAPVSLDANITINGDLTFTLDNKLFNINDNNLTLGSSATVVNADDNNFIQTSGNAGDEGLTKVYSAASSTFTFPVGAVSTSRPATAAFTPATIGFSSAPTSYGSITVIPVGNEHPVTSAGGNALTYYWRIKSSGITGYAGNVTHNFSYNASDVTGSETNYLPAVYDPSTYTWSRGEWTDFDGVNDEFGDWTTPTVSANFLDGEYTAGTEPAFGTPTIYYSRQSGEWSNTATWSLSGHTIDDEPSNVPNQGDVVIIGGNDSIFLSDEGALPTNNNNPNNNFYRLDEADVRCASLKIEAGSVLDIQNNPGSDFGTVVSHENGNGKIMITTRHATNFDAQMTFAFPGGDFSDFNKNLGTTELYTINPQAGTTFWLPNGVTEYGNLIISPLGGSNIIFPNNDLLIYGNLITRGQNSESWFCPNWRTLDYPTAPATPVAKTITVNGNFDIQGGALVWYNRNGTGAQDFIVYGDLEVATDAGIQVYTNGTGNTQSFSIGGNLINNSLAPGGSPDQFRGCDFSNIPLTFFGDSTYYITNDDPADNTYTNIETLTVNKGSSQSDSLVVNITGTFNTPTNNWLTLQNGTFKYERDADLNITTTSSFTIPSTAGLYVDASGRTIRLANASSNTNDVYLNGKLTIIDGNVTIGNTNNNNQDIEYSGGGGSEIEIQGGTLFVNGQIRRNPSTTAGVLKYNQTGGDVTINGRNTLASNAKLEILNTGSEFNMSAGTITIVRGGGDGTYGDLYLRPENSTVTGGEIIFDPSGAGDQNYLLDANVPIWDLTINGSGGDNADVELLISSLEVDNDLTIVTATSTFDANVNFDIPVTINGDFENNGTYNYRENTTTFNGTVQSILGTSGISFYDLVVNPVTSLTLSNDATINNDLTLASGTLICGNYYVYSKGDVTNNATYTDNSTGIELNGTSLQYLGGTGTWGQLELNNSSGGRLVNEITLQSDFLLTNGILDINKYLFTLGVNSDIVGSNFSSSKMITSDGVFSNVGVRKYYSIYSGAQITDSVPIGTLGKYTPVAIKYTDNTNVGYIRVNNINSNHPGVIDPTNVLDYFWEIESNGISGFNGSIDFSYLEGDVQVTGVNTEADYIAAALLLPGTTWTKAAPGPGTDRVDETTNTISFNYSGSNSLSGEYTAGIDAALPDQVPEYTSNDDGNWSDPTKWDQTGGDPYTLSGGPNGFIVIIEADDTITTDANYASAYRITLNGTLDVSSATFGHNLGTLSGSGTLKLESGTIPAGRYTDFFDCSNNATLEYGGTGTYSLIADLYSTIPNLHFTGTGSRILPNKDLTICTRLFINGPTLDNSVNNRMLTIQGTLERYGTGVFTSGSGSNATVSFEGSAAQTVGGAFGDFNGTNAFNNLEIDNSAGLTVNNAGAIEVKRNLLLTDGIINTTSTATLTITNTAINCVTPAGGSSASYVSGPLTKTINQGDNFSYPVGKGSNPGNKINLSSTRTGTIDWTVEYFNPNSTAGDRTSPLTYVNNDDYWTVSATAGDEAIINLDWDPSSDLTPLMTQNGLSDMRVARYNTGTSSWEELSSTASGNSSNGTVSTASRITVPAAGSSDFTIACINVVKPRAQFTPAGAVCGSDGIPVSFTYSGPIPFDYTIDYTINGAPQTQINITSGDVPYTLPTSSAGTYQLTAFTYNSGADIGVVDPTEVDVYDNPTTAAAGNDQSLCGATSAILDGNTPLVGSGLWTIGSGTGGTVVTPTSPTSDFNGTNGTTYSLIWTISEGSCTSSDTVVIDFPLLPVQPPAFITSSAEVCEGQSGVAYAVANDPTVTYGWAYSGTGETINGTSNSVTVDFAIGATDGTLSVNATNGCGTSTDLTIGITVNPIPTITLTDPNIQVCQGGTSVDLEFSATTGTPDEYNIDFDITAEGEGFVDTANAPLGSSPIAINVPGGASIAVYNANLTVTNSVPGCVSIDYPITITVAPIPAPTITGNDSLCVGTSVVYTTEASMNNYLWTVDGTYGSISAGAGTNSITVDWTDYTALGSPTTVSVTYDDAGCLPASAGTIDVMIFKIPATGPQYHIDNSFNP